MVNVDPRSRGNRYVADDSGAPPIPPEGGYRGARRLPTAATARVAAEVPEEQRPRSSWLGGVALAISIAFAFVLLIMLASSSTDAIFNLNLLAVQIGVVALIVVAVFTPRGRFLGGIALAIALVVNVATIGGLATAKTTATGATRPDTQQEQQDNKWLAYPGVKGTSPSTILGQPSLEQVRSSSDAFMKEVRERLTARFGFTWTSQREAIIPMRNGYGGESMLKQYRSVRWYTNETARGTQMKQQIMEEIESVVNKHNGGSFTSLNDPRDTSRDGSLLKKLYGSDDPDKQALWESGAFIEGRASFYTDIYDLGNDPTGSFRKSREGANQRTGEPVEGVQLLVTDDELLSEKDKQSFRDKIQDY